MARIVSLLVASFGVYLVYVVASGAIYFYIHPIYVIPTLGTGIVLLVAAAIGFPGWRETSRHAGPSRVAVALAAVPLAVGLLLPARPLGVSTAAQRGVDAIPLGRIEDLPEFRVDRRPETYTIKDWVKILQADPEPERQSGKPVRLTGFVYRDPRLPGDWFLVARFVVQCCAVDAQPIGLPVRLPAEKIPSAGVWVAVTGTWAVAEVRGERRAVIVPAAVTPTDRPDQPYLY
jgi:putative membrane protein